jgi:hypothetical protein
MAAGLAGPPLSDAERLLWLVRRMQPTEFARTFRRGLADAELMQVISALPAERWRPDSAHPPSSGPNPQVPALPDRRADQSLATAIYTARQQTQMSQLQLARLAGPIQRVGLHKLPADRTRVARLIEDAFRA